MKILQNMMVSFLSVAKSVNDNILSIKIHLTFIHIRAVK